MTSNQLVELVEVKAAFSENNLDCVSDEKIYRHQLNFSKGHSLDNEEDIYRQKQNFLHGYSPDNSEEEAYTHKQNFSHGYPLDIVEDRISDLKEGGRQLIRENKEGWKKLQKRLGKI